MTMKTRNNICCLALMFTALTTLTAQTKVPPKKRPATTSAASVKTPARTAASLPSKEEVEAAMKRTFGYDPSITWEIYEIRSAVIPGVSELTVSVNKQPAIHIYLSPDHQ